MWMIAVGLRPDENAPLKRVVVDLNEHMLAEAQFAERNDPSREPATHVPSSGLAQRGAPACRG